MHQVSAGVAGFFFGLGLAISGMTQPGKVVAFLDVAGGWDPSLAFVMGGALMVFGPTYYLVSRRREKPVLAPAFDMPKAREITPQLLVGATIFGVGWGLGGFCPGTAITSLPTLGAEVLALVSGVVIGILATWGAQKALAEDGSTVVPQADF